VDLSTILNLTLDSLGQVKSILQFVNMAWCPLADSLKRFSKTPLKKQTAE
jgi:hypothetical protein